MSLFIPESVEQAQAWLKERLNAASGSEQSVQLCGGSTREWLTPLTSAGPRLSASALRKVHWIDAEDRTCRVEAGISVAELDRTLAEHKLCFAHSESWAFPALSAPQSTLAGLLMGGVPSLSAAQLGLPRDQVLAATWLLADGSRVQTGARVVKSVAGYDLTRLLMGSRGQLAFCVDLTLRLRPRPSTLIWSEQLAAEASAWLDVEDRAGVVQLIPARSGTGRIELGEAQARLATRFTGAFGQARAWTAHAAAFPVGTFADGESLRDRVGLQSLWSIPPKWDEAESASRTWPPRPIDLQRLTAIQQALVPAGHAFGGRC